MPANKHVLDPWLIGGSSLYWASVVLSFMFSDASTSPAASPEATVSSYALVALYILAILCCRKVFTQGRKRQVVAVLMAVANIGYVIGESVPSAPSAILLALRALYLAAVACQMVLWGFAYASLEKTRACQNVCCTVLTASVLVLLVAAVSKTGTFDYIPQVLNVLATVALATGKVYFADHHHKRESRPTRPLVFFAVTRFAFGFCIGFCMQVPQQIGLDEGSVPYLALGIATLCAAFCVYILSSDRLYSAMPSLLVIAIVALFLPFLYQGEHAAVALSAGFAWLAWAVLSAVQLSELKESCGISELTICVAEKSLLSLSIVLGAFAYAFLRSAAPALTASTHLDMFATASTWALVLVALYTMASLVGAHKEDEYALLLQTDNQEKSERLYRGLAEEFGLSERERKVVEMLAEGYTRTYIKDALGVSEGTVKAHVAHVYQKLGIHRKDDLLDMVEARRKRMNAHT